MALIRKFEHKSMERNSIHKEIGATYSIFERDDRVFVQIDTYGTDDRSIPGKKSQTIQVDETGAHRLVDILRRAFRF